MPIFDQGYQHWNGELAGHAWRWLAVAREGVRTQLRKKGSKALLILGFGPALTLSSALIIWGLLEQQSSLLDPIRPLLGGLPEEILAGPKAYRTPFWTMAYNYFFRVQIFFTFLLVLIVGPDLISQDLRFNAMPLYFARPVRRIDYFLGKLGVIAFFLAAVAIVPALVAYALGVSFSFELSVFRDTGRLLLAVLAFGAVTVLSAGTLMLALSSLSRNSRFVGASWVGLWVVSGIASQSLQDTVRQDWCPLVSYQSNLDRVREELLDTKGARARFLALMEAGKNAGREAAMKAAPLPFGRRGGGLFSPPPPPPPPSRTAESILEDLKAGETPWSWSAGVLAGLFGLSVWTLSMRVKSLDRLK
jgi:ABC-2 type transport system permease protein